MKRSAKKYFIVFIAVLIIAFLLFSFTGCKGKHLTEKESTAEDTPGDTISNTEEPPKASEDKQTETTAESSVPETTEEEQEEEIPQEITDLIETADGYYSAKEYGLAKNTYRKAEIAIDDSNLSDGTKQQLKNSFNSKYEESKKIIETAKTHYTNAKQLEYEQQYRAALKELEAALAIYPNYKEALEEYENLKTQMGLK